MCASLLSEILLFFVLFFKKDVNTKTRCEVAAEISFVYLISFSPFVFSSSPFFFSQFGRTEVIDNTLNPDFVRKYILDYFFEEKQNLRFDL